MTLKNQIDSYSGPHSAMAPTSEHKNDISYWFAIIEDISMGDSQFEDTFQCWMIIKFNNQEVVCLYSRQDRVVNMCA